MHRLLLPPTGWGFMLTHDWRGRGAMVVTDGGSYSACYRVTLGTIGGFLGHGVKPPRRVGLGALAHGLRPLLHNGRPD